jgi:hypothetical protein
MPAIRRPLSGVLPWKPWSISMPTTALQLP